MRKNFVAIAIAVAAVAAFRFILIFRYGFDSDEPQHMHVAWAWAHGLVQYRDVFDNHMPLFHLLAAPLFLLRGEGVHLLFLARFAVVPLYVAALLLVWKISRRLYDERAAWWTAAMTALFAPFFLGTLEFRTDDLWVVLWLGAILAAVGYEKLEVRSWRASLLIGLAFAVSMKSTLFALSLGGAVAGTWALTWRGRQPIEPRRAVRIAMTAATMIVLPSAVIAAAFAAAGAWGPFKYGVFLHNVFPDEGTWRVFWLIPGALIARAGVRALLQSDVEVPLMRRRLFVFLACVLFGTILSALWPMLSLESYLPLYPLVLIVAMPTILEASAILGRRDLLVKACLAVEIVSLLMVSRPWKDETHEETDLVAEVLSITSPDDPVMDLKGETLFRARPYYLVIESITNRKYRFGRISDTIADSLVKSATHVVATDRLPQRSRRFVNANYVPWGRVRVAGFRVPSLEAGEAVPVSVRIPGEYVLLGDQGPVEMSVDGGGYTTRAFIGPGEHQIATRTAVGQPLMVWSKALLSHRTHDNRVQALREAQDPRTRARVVAQDLPRTPEGRIVTAGG